MYINKEYSENLFSYGTLQQEQVQIETFKRILTGQNDILTGYSIKTLKITDPEVIRKSGKDVHSIIEFTGNKNDQVPGKVFQISLQELKQADEYEVADYKRVQVTLKSGVQAWVYINKKSQ